MTTRTGTRIIATAVALSALAGPTAAQAAPLRYVALGDSYSAGSGVAPYASKAKSQCLQSTRNYPKVLAKRLRTTVKDVSCAGARTTDFRTAQFSQVGPQLNALSRKTELVTLTIGGNDSGAYFGSFFACAFTFGRGQTCEQRFGQTAQDRIRNTTYPDLLRAIRDVKARAPKATVAVLTYPRIMPATVGCRPAMPIYERDVPYVYDVQQTLHDVIVKAARTAGAFLVDLDGPSKGHDACQPAGVRWVEPVRGGSNVIHPAANGEQAMAEQALRALVRRAGSTNAAVRRALKRRR